MIVPPGRTNPTMRDLLLSPIRRDMANQQRNAQVKPGPSSVGGCQRKLAFAILYPELKVSTPSGWASTRGTVLHAWYDALVKSDPECATWKSNLKLPSVVEAVTGGSLDLFVGTTVVDEKYPGDWSMKKVTAGEVSFTYYGQIQTYGLGAEMLGLTVERVGLLFVPVAGDDLDRTIYLEWDYDRPTAIKLLSEAERIRREGQAGDRRAILDAATTKDDWCSSCDALLAGMCPGETKSRGAWRPRTTPTKGGDPFA